MEHLQYPVGRYKRPAFFSEDQRREWLDSIAKLPGELKDLEGLFSATTLQSRYRPGSWTCQQLIHHMADSHLNALLRIKFGLTLDNPTVTSYDENEFALLEDYKRPVSDAILMLSGIHAKLVALIETMTPEQFDRPLFHPEFGGMTLKDVAAMYAWHSRHHLAHIKICLGLLKPEMRIH